MMKPDDFKNIPKVNFNDYFKDVQSGMFLEFGVSKGNSIKNLASLTKGPVYGFDSFEGLPEDWVADSGKVRNGKGSFKCEPPKNLPSNITLVIGLFQDTLPEFLESHPGPIGAIHMDCDLYSSHKFVLDCLKDRLDGTVLIFDDLLEYDGNVEHGFRAFKEFLEETDYQATCLGSHGKPHAGFKLTKK